MLDVVKGNILSVERGIIVQGCNCQGVMGGGLAAQIRAKWPSVYAIYRKRFDAVGLRLGEVVSVGARGNPFGAAVQRHLDGTSTEIPRDVIVSNAMTQDEFGRDPNRVYADYDGITAAFSTIKLLARDSGLPVHVPLIGCGLANGKWEEVGPRIELALGDSTPVTLWLYE